MMHRPLISLEGEKPSIQAIEKAYVKAAENAMTFTNEHMEASSSYLPLQLTSLSNHHSSTVGVLRIPLDNIISEPTEVNWFGISQTL